MPVEVGVLLEGAEVLTVRLHVVIDRREALVARHERALQAHDLRGELLEHLAFLVRIALEVELLELCQLLPDGAQGQALRPDERFLLEQLGLEPAEVVRLDLVLVRVELLELIDDGRHLPAVFFPLRLRLLPELFQLFPLFFGLGDLALHLAL